jgi:L-amino acid N-acyltransferase YncA
MLALMRPIVAAGVYTVLPSLSLDQQRQFVQSFPEHGVLHVAVCDKTGKILGMQDVQPLSGSVPAWRHVGEISTFVGLDTRRSGIGRRLMAATLPRAHELGFRKLMATIRGDNSEALAFYLSQGFNVVGPLREHALVDGRYLDEIMTERLLSDLRPSDRD